MQRRWEIQDSNCNSLLSVRFNFTKISWYIFDSSGNILYANDNWLNIWNEFSNKYLKIVKLIFTLLQILYDLLMYFNFNFFFRYCSLYFTSFFISFHCNSCGNYIFELMPIFQSTYALTSTTFNSITPPLHLCNTTLNILKFHSTCCHLAV